MQKGSETLKTVNLAYLRCSKGVAFEVEEQQVSRGREVEYDIRQAMKTSSWGLVSIE